MHFGGVAALQGVTFTVARGAITAIIGPNGAGKTTVFNCLTGFYAAAAGVVRLQREEGEIDLMRAVHPTLQPRDYLNPRALARQAYGWMTGGTHKVVRAGVARTFQNVRLFRDMTVLENLLVAQHRLVERRLWAGILRTREYLAAEAAALDRAVAWLELFGMFEDANRLAGELPYGQQRRLEIIRALCTDPVLLCLDEPAAGLNPRETQALSRMILRLRDHHDLTILLIEHDMNLVMNISDHVVVLDHGEVIASGTPAAMQGHPAVLEAYLGVAEPVDGASGGGLREEVVPVSSLPPVPPKPRPPLIIDPSVADIEACPP
ncbi:MAG: ABC transporter ATP-binding protein [Magnetococcales bacterium]|nr:ABC transporter ATP-binding protein [Magnetococcales bacterium]